MTRTYSALIFDLDGTLVDSYEPITESLNYVRTAFGLRPKTLDEVRLEVGRGLDSLVRDNIGEERTEEGVRLFRARYRKVFREGTRLLPGVGATVRELARRAVPMAITSNKPAYFSREIVEHLGFGGAFVGIIGPEMVEHPKPDPEMVRMAIALIDRPDAEVLYVGDMRIDIDTCRRAGIAVCAIASGSETREILAAARPDIMIDRFEELLALVGA